MGSETFIIVAFICNENRTPLFFASKISSLKNVSKLSKFITDVSTISSFNMVILFFKVSCSPLSFSNTILTVCILTDVSEISVLKKSPDFILETCVCESTDHLPIK